MKILQSLKNKLINIIFWRKYCYFCNSILKHEWSGRYNCNICYQKYNTKVIHWYYDNKLSYIYIDYDNFCVEIILKEAKMKTLINICARDFYDVRIIDLDKAIKLPGCPITPQNIKDKLPLILNFQ